MRQNILLIRFSSLGDVALTSAVVTNLRINRPGSRIIFLTKERFAPVVGMMPGVDEIITIPNDTNMREFARMLGEVERKQIDVIVDLHGNFRSIFTSKLTTASEKLVYPKRRRERQAIVKQKPVLRPVMHTIDAYNLPLREVGMITPCKRPILTCDPELSNLVWKGSHSQSVRVLFAPGAAHEPKRWPIESFAELARQLDKRMDTEIVWVLAKDEESIMSPVIDDIPGQQLVGLPLSELAATISEASITVSNDSGVAHLSSGLGTPVVALFGPTHPALGFAPRGLFDTIVEADEPCRPCSLHGASDCYREEQFCFTRIEPDHVLAAIDHTLDLTQDLKPAVFVDRDGTIIADKHFLSDPDQVEILPGVIEALRKLNSMGLKTVIVSNQSGVARGYFDVSTAETVNARLLEILQRAGINVDGLYFCPHFPHGKRAEYSYVCECRKPSPGMAETAARQIGIDLRKSYVIGDKLDDYNLALAMGATPIMVRTGHGLNQIKLLPPELIDDSVVDDLATAATRINRLEH